MRRLAPLWLALAVFVAAVALEAARPDPFDERLRLERQGTEPFDAEALFRLLPGTLGAPVVVVERPPFEWLADSTRTGTAYLFLTDVFAPDAAEAGRLLAYAERGNTVWVSARTVGGPLFEALGAPPEDSLRPGGVLARTWGELSGLADFDAADELVLFDSAVGGRFAMPLFVSSSTFEGLDAARTDALGADADWIDGDAVFLDAYTVNYVRIRAGRGTVLVHGAPVAFTNAALAADSGQAAAYLAGVLSYLPDADTVFWDATHKPLRARATRLDQARQDPALRWAVSLVLLGALFFVAFRGRRWQRAVPVVAPPPNAQREFARVLGRLHLVRDDRAWLARQKARLVRERLRTRYGLDAQTLSDDLARTAAARAGRPEAEALALFARLRDLEADAAPSPDRLLALDRDIEAFFREETADA